MTKQVQATEPVSACHGTDEVRITAAQFKMELWFTYYLNWGYPDYLEAAVKRLGELNPERVIPADMELPWSTINQLLAEVDTVPVKLLVASSPRTSQAVLDYLSQERTTAVAERVAENPTAHPATLERLAAHQQADVRLAAAEHPALPGKMLSTLVNDESPDVRYRLAENSTLPAHLLEQLSEDENPYVATRAASTLRLLRGASVVSGDFAKPARRKRLLSVSQ
jgi:hypothetical protein